jgi:hypothetical protein
MRMKRIEPKDIDIMLELYASDISIQDIAVKYERKPFQIVGYFRRRGVEVDILDLKQQRALNATAARLKQQSEGRPSKKILAAIDLLNKGGTLSTIAYKLKLSEAYISAKLAELNIVPENLIYQQSLATYESIINKAKTLGKSQEHYALLEGWTIHKLNYWRKQYDKCKK